MKTPVVILMAAAAALTAIRHIRPSRTTSPGRAHLRHLVRASNGAPVPRAPGNRFIFSPWQMNVPNGGQAVQIFPAPVTSGEQFYGPANYRRILEKAPAPASRWETPALPATLDFDRDTGVPCAEGKMAYFYFRTVLNVPSRIPLGSVLLLSRRADDFLTVYVNGHPVSSTDLTGDLTLDTSSIPLGRYLRHGHNAIRLLLGDACTLTRLHGVLFTARSSQGRVYASLAAVLSGRDYGTTAGPSESRAPNGVDTVIPAGGPAPRRDARGVLLIPIRPVIDAVGGTLVWDNGQKDVQGVFGRRRFEVGVVTPTGRIDGQQLALDASASLDDGTLRVPLSFLQRVLGANLRWDETHHTLVITTVLSFPP